MSAVPHAKAGVGSAVNDTTREVGGALGIAMLGSISNAVYRSNIHLDGLELPPPMRAAAEESVGAATALARSIPGGGELAARAGDAFTKAFNVTSRVAVGVSLAAAVVVTVVFNRRAELAAAGHTPDPSTPPLASELATEPG